MTTPNLLLTEVVYVLLVPNSESFYLRQNEKILKIKMNTGEKIMLTFLYLLEIYVSQIKWSFQTQFTGNNQLWG